MNSENFRSFKKIAGELAAKEIYNNNYYHKSEGKGLIIRAIPHKTKNGGLSLFKQVYPYSERIKWVISISPNTSCTK
jgi:hypothetical protein